MADEKGKKVSFHFKKTESYRSFYANGAWGGLTPSGNVYMEFFIERFATPNYFEQYVNDNGEVVGEVPGTRESKEGIIRQIEAGVMMDLSTAKSVNKWLSEKIAELENALKKEKDNVGNS